MTQDSHQQRGLVILSALINFVDWLDAEARSSSQRGVSLLPVAERERGQLVLRFLKAHSECENYFMQAEQIAGILGKPFRGQP